MTKSNKGEIIIYQLENNLPALEVRLEEDTVWLTQKQMSELFEKNIMTINEHIKNIYTEGELQTSATIRKFLIVQKEGARLVRRRVNIYNLDVIISVGYRVKSIRGTQFRIWATNILKQHIIQGYTINEKRLREAHDNFKKLKKSVDVFQRVVENRTLTDAEARSALQELISAEAKKRSAGNAKVILLITEPEYILLDSLKYLL